MNKKFVWIGPIIIVIVCLGLLLFPYLLAPFDCLSVKIENAQSIVSLLQGLASNALISLVLYFFLDQKYKHILSGNDRITIKLQVPDTDGMGMELPASILRKHVTRAEVLGCLGLYNQQRIKLDFLSTKKFFEMLHQVQEGKQDHIVIECTHEELQQFDSCKNNQPSA